MNVDTEYRKLCEDEPSIPLFSQAWWLDAVAEGKWNVALVKAGDEIMASMPYVTSTKYQKNFITQPALTQTLGPWIRSTNAKYANRLSREKDLMESLIVQLPDYVYFSQNWDYSQSNWLPFFWKGFKQTTRYTYRIDALNDEKKLWDELLPNIRTDIKKASNREGLTVRTDLDIDSFYKLNSLVFQRQGKNVPYTFHFIQKLDEAAAVRNQRRIFIAEDKQGRHHAAVYLVWDDNSAYYLMGGSDPALRKSGATSLCMWEAIRFASTVTNSFDFEGSMLEPVERFFRSFGAIQTPYHNVSHTPSRILRLAKSLKEMM